VRVVDDHGRAGQQGAAHRGGGVARRLAALLRRYRRDGFRRAGLAPLLFANPSRASPALQGEPEPGKPGSTKRTRAGQARLYKGRKST
jgi:hypothetical protein